MASTFCCLDLLNLAHLRRTLLHDMAIYQVPRLFLLTPDLGSLVYPMGSSCSSYQSHVFAGCCNGLWGDYWALLVVFLGL